MNALQIIRKARFEADAIRAAGTTSGMWIDEEMVGLLNNAVDRAYKILRLAGSTITTRAIDSSSATALDLVEESYAPSSLRLVDGTIDYTLPPDFIRVVQITPVTVNFDLIKFHPIEANDPDYADYRALPDSALSSVESGETNYHYLILGDRTIRFVPEPRDTIDIELLYQYRPPRLLNYGTGTVAITISTTALVGTTTDWIVYGLRTPAELIPAAASTVTLDRYYPRIATFLTATTATMQRNYQTTSLAAATYAISMVPILPEEHHEWLAQMVAALMLRKVSLDESTKAVAALEAELHNEVQPELGSRQINESRTIQPFIIAD